MMIVLKNDKITAKISEKGAELKSVFADGFEYIWEADPAVWGSSSPVLFPICGALKDDKYVFGGKTYEMPKHGIVRKELFKVEDAGESRAVFLFCSNEETKKMYPFDFEFRVAFELNGRTLNVTYSAKNTGNGKMYFNIGGHPAFSCPEGISHYDLVFEQKETLNQYINDSGILNKNTSRVITDTNTLSLEDKMFEIDSMLFEGVKSDSLILRNRDNKREVKFGFGGFRFLTVWTKPGAKYICLEPWTGAPDFIGSSYELTEKYGINSIDAGETFSVTNKITF